MSSGARSSTNTSRMASGPIALDSLTKACPVSGLRTHWRRSESRLKEEKVKMYEEVIKDIYGHLHIGTTDFSREMSVKEFAVAMRTALEGVFTQHGRVDDLKDFEQAGQMRSALWTERKQKLEELAAAKKDLESAAVTITILEQELRASDGEITRQSGVVPPLVARSNSFMEADNKISQAAEAFKRIKRGEISRYR